jgi:hypothetical protein
MHNWPKIQSFLVTHDGAVADLQEVLELG